MKRYSVEMLREGAKQYYYICHNETLELEENTTRYLTHKTKANRSPNTVQRCAYALCAYLEYLAEKELEIASVYEMAYEAQYRHFTGFLIWYQNEGGRNVQKKPENNTCNAYLKEVFRFYSFLEETEAMTGLKVLSARHIEKPNAVGVRRVVWSKRFRGYLEQSPRSAKAARREDIRTALEACTNCRDQLLLLMLAETGFRLGELLGVDYCQDIDYENHLVRVRFRPDNENGARAKNAENREAKLSDGTFRFLLYYLAEYWNLLQGQRMLFIQLEGKKVGQALDAEGVYGMLRHLEKETGVKLTPHMLRRYFANTRRAAGWQLELLQKAMGHKQLDTTIRYLNIVDDELIQASNAFYEKNAELYGVMDFLRGGGRNAGRSSAAEDRADPEKVVCGDSE